MAHIKTKGQWIMPGRKVWLHPGIGPLVLKWVVIPFISSVSPAGQCQDYPKDFTCDDQVKRAKAAHISQPPFKNNRSAKQGFFPLKLQTSIVTLGDSVVVTQHLHCPVIML
ncbi:hypothetical protein ElyMa_001035300 [Elysia marginata]|uniref:Uncharacterized protein n=1 Tax=Elysia marginata TaxID=1093978 RepID=A0AAV4HND5_9GAST|nr:hypothetical protein ElyMa_001035300 [Elysia marginata]